MLKAINILRNEIESLSLKIDDRQDNVDISKKIITRYEKEILTLKKEREGLIESALKLEK